MIENDPRINPNLAVDLADEYAKSQAERQADAVAAREKEIKDAQAWYKAMRRMTGQRDRFDVFLKARVRQQQREQAGR